MTNILLSGYDSNYLRGDFALDLDLYVLLSHCQLPGAVTANTYQSLLSVFQSILTLFVLAFIFPHTFIWLLCSASHFLSSHCFPKERGKEAASVGGKEAASVGGQDRGDIGFFCSQEYC